ncbi:hypothetical protein JL722_7100 [Aureococcus anophagefferens]|nr:hypothetical protein JL722_7100 [Aureococcus anophagefferens]
MSRWSPLLLLLLGGSVGDEAGIDVVIEATAADVYYALPYALFALRRRGRGFVGSITVSYAAAERRDFAKLEKVFPASPGNGTRRDVVFTSAGAPGGARLAADAVAFRRRRGELGREERHVPPRARRRRTGALRAALRCVALEDADFGDAARALRRCGDVARRERRGGAARLCLDGRLAPEHFVIGAQKAGTTTFASALAAQPSIVLPGARPRAPGRSRTSSTGPCSARSGCGATPPANGRPARRTSRPPSRPPGPRRPRDRRAPLGAAAALGLDATPVLYVDAAPKIVAQYGALAPRLSFTVLLRDPVGRTASAFHNWVWGPFAGSKYADHLRAWFAALAPSQFAVVPFRYLDDDPPRRALFPWTRKRTERAPPPPLAPRDAANESALDFTLRRLGLPLPETRAVDCIALNRRRARWRRWPRGPCNARARAPEDDALSPASAAALAKLVATHVSPLKVARVLAGAPGEEPPQLFAFRGDAKDPAAVADWLARSW